MTETPREIREKLIMQWYEKKLNRDELLRVLDGKLDKGSREKVESEIIQNFYENFDKAKQDEEFKSAESQYKDIKSIQRKIDKKSKELTKKKRLTEKELKEIEDEKLEIGIASMSLEDGAWWKRGKLMKTNARRDELTEKEKQINGEINQLNREKQALLASLHNIEKSYGPKFERPQYEVNKTGNTNKIQEKINADTLIGYKERYAQLVKAKEEYMQNLLSNMKELDLGISEDKKRELLEIVESNMEKEINNLKGGDEFVKLANEREKRLKKEWKTMMQKLLDLRGMIQENEAEIEKIESDKISSSTDEIGEIIEKEFELKKKLIEMKNEYESIKDDISTKVQQYDGSVIDRTKPIYLETWAVRKKREEIGKKQREEENKIRENTKSLLKEYRENWHKTMGYCDSDVEKIIKASEEIPVKIDIDGDGSRLIELKVGNRIYKILDPILDKHTYSSSNYQVQGRRREMILPRRRTQVYLKGITGNDVDKRENEPLREYVKQKENEGLHIPSKGEMEELLNRLGDIAGLNNEQCKIGLLMYLTGIDGGYRLADEGPDGRSAMLFNQETCYGTYRDGWRLNLLMMSVSES